MAGNHNYIRHNPNQASDEARRISQANATGNFFLGTTPKSWMTTSTTDLAQGMPARLPFIGIPTSQNPPDRQAAPINQAAVSNSSLSEQGPAAQRNVSQEQLLLRRQQVQKEAVNQTGLFTQQPTVVNATAATPEYPVFQDVSPLLFSQVQQSPLALNEGSFPSSSSILPDSSPTIQNFRHFRANQYPQRTSQSQQFTNPHDLSLATERQNAEIASNNDRLGYSAPEFQCPSRIAPNLGPDGHSAFPRAQPPSSLPAQDLLSLTFHGMARIFEPGNMGWVEKGVDRYRAELLREAYNSQDAFFLCVHQVLCIYALDPATTTIKIDQRHRASLDMLPGVMLHGDRPSLSALKVFAAFPEPIDRLVNEVPGYENLLNQVAIFLQSLAAQWDQMLRICLQRRYPPLVQEQIMSYQLKSPILQRLIFCSVQRAISGDHSPELNLQALAIFDEDLNNSLARLAAGHGPLSGQQLQAELGRLATRYHDLISKSFSVIAQRAPLPHLGPDQSSPITQASPDVPFHPTAPYQQPTPQRRPSQPQPRFPYAANTFINAPMSSSPVPDQPLTHSNLGIQSWGLRTSAPTTPAALSPGIYSSSSGTPIARQTMPVTSRRASSGRGAPSRQLHNSFSHSIPNPRNRPKNLLIPPLGVEPIDTTRPDTDRVALHQAHLRSPRLEKTDSTGNSAPDTKLYQYVSGFAVAPTIIGNNDSWLLTQFDVQRNSLTMKAKDIGPSEYAMPRRLVADGSITYRLRMVQLESKAVEIGESEFLAKDMCWPSATFITFNDQKKELRRKLHHHRDLPIDLTGDIREGTNELSIALLGPPAKADTDKFAYAVEIVQVGDQTRVDSLVSYLPADESLRSIMQSLITPKVPNKPSGTSMTAGPSTNDVNIQPDRASAPALTPSPTSDVDIQILDAHLSIDLIDPFTAVLVTNPARSTVCTHRECFDLQAFMSTRRPRSSQRPDAPTNPDEWKCPICSCDARPKKLIIDSFLKMVRDSLGKTKDQDGAREDGENEARAILVQADGSWSVKKDEVKRSGRGGSAKAGDGVGNGGGDGVGLGLMLGDRSSAARQEPIEVIDLLD